MTERLDKMGLSRLWRAIQYNLINKQDTLIPGQGVNITDNVISCTSSGGGSGSIDSVYYGKCLSLSEDSIILIKARKSNNLCRNKKTINCMKIKFLFFFITTF